MHEASIPRASLTVIVPTVSRPTLARTLKSLTGQWWEPEDRIIVLGDGRQPQAKALTAQFASRYGHKYVEYLGGPCNDWSHTPRNWLLHKIGLTTTHFCILDDDDVWVSDAARLIHLAIEEAPTAMHLFRMDCTTRPDVGKVLWANKEIREANVGTPMSVCPVDDKIAYYGTRYGGDFDFIHAESQTHDVVWHEEVICLTRPL